MLMTISISYASQREEVWQWYWRVWRRSLWKIHLGVFAAVALASSFFIFDDMPVSLKELLIVSAIAALPLAAFVAFPMLMFKPETRTLSISSSGIATTIGKRSGNIPWTDIINVREEGDALVIQRRNLNAFVIPMRAFKTTAEKSEFADFAHAMLLASNS